MGIMESYSERQHRLDTEAPRPTPDMPSDQGRSGPSSVEITRLRVPMGDVFVLVLQVVVSGAVIGGGSWVIVLVVLASL